MHNKAYGSVLIAFIELHKNIVYILVNMLILLLRWFYGIFSLFDRPPCSHSVIIVG